MNNQREIYEALLAGETLTRDDTAFVKLNDAGLLVDAGTGEHDKWEFYPWEPWQIYKEPAWYENIPEGGVLCWCGTSKSLRLIESSVNKSLSLDSNVATVFRTKDYDESDWWLLCRPATKQEIQVFMDNAPEE